MRQDIDSRDAQLAQVGSELRKAMSAEKKQTERMRRLEMSLSEREEMVRNMDRQLRAAEGAGAGCQARRGAERRNLWEAL